MLLDIPQNTMADIMSHHAHHFPDKTALVFDDRRLTWGEMVRGINRVANRLLAAGLRKGDKVCLLMSTSADHFLLMFGTMRAGGSAVPLSALLSPAQLQGLIGDAGARFLFVDQAHRHLLATVEDRLESVRADGFYADEAGGRWANFHAWLDGASEAEPAVRLMLDDEATISYSSGTTGTPKGVVYTHRARFHFGLAYAWHLKTDGDAIGIATTPLYSNGTSIILFPVLFAGGTMVFMKAFDARAFLGLVARERATHTFMVPTQFVKVLDDPSLPSADLSSMQVFVTAGSPMRVDLKRAFVAAVGPRLAELYGLSEGGVTMIRPDELVKRPDSVGKPLPGFEARILGPDDTELPRGQVGEIAFYGGWAMRGYQNQPELTAAVIWRDARGRSFVRSGDIGRMDADGYLYVLDRKKDMIISGGFNVFPVDIEAVLAQHPSVEEVAVIGVAHRLWGESPLGLVVLKAGHAADPEGLRLWANERLAKTQRLAAVVVRDGLTRNALGKVQKAALRLEYAGFQAP